MLYALSTLRLNRDFCQCPLPKWECVTCLARLSKNFCKFMLFECIEVYLLFSFSDFALRIPRQFVTSQLIYPIKMAKDKSEKKERRRSEVKVAQPVDEDVEMENTEVAKVRAVVAYRSV